MNIFQITYERVVIVYGIGTCTSHVKIVSMYAVIPVYNKTNNSLNTWDIVNFSSVKCF